MLESAESGSESRRPASAEASLHTASCFQRSARTMRRTFPRRTRAKTPHRAPAPAPSAVSVRFQLVVIVCLLRFPAVVPFASPARGSVPGPASPGSLSGVPSIGFKSVKIMFVLSLAQAPRCAAFRSDRPAFFPSVPPRSASAKFRSGSDGVPPSGIPVYHPVPASCSVRFPFVSFMVRISVRFVFVSVRFPFGSVQSALSSSVRPVPAHSCSFQFVFRSIVPVRSAFPFVPFVLSVSFVRCARSQAIYYIFPAYIIHEYTQISNVFFAEKHVFFKKSTGF